MIAVASLLSILLLSLLVTRIASVALVHTGLGVEAARFQARSAFSGAGYTTSEAEDIVAHPVRRRIVSWLMMAGNVGLVTAMSSLLISVLGAERSGGAGTLVALAVGVAILAVIASSSWVDAILSRCISWSMNRFTDLDARDYARLLHIRHDYGVTELVVGENDWISGRTVGEANLECEGILVLAIECPGGSFIGAPPPDTRIGPHDTLILYGRTPRIAELDRRAIGPGGDQLHAAASDERNRIAAEERAAAKR
jgi:hypothetical protein